MTNGGFAITAMGACNNKSQQQIKKGGKDFKPQARIIIDFEAMLLWPLENGQKALSIPEMRKNKVSHQIRVATHQEGRRQQGLLA